MDTHTKKKRKQKTKNKKTTKIKQKRNFFYKTNNNSRVFEKEMKIKIRQCFHSSIVQYL